MLLILDRHDCSTLEELNRLDGMVEQMLFLARHSMPGAALDRQHLAAGALLREVAAFFGASELTSHRFLELRTAGLLIGGLAVIVLLIVNQYRSSKPLLTIRAAPL